MTLSNHKVNRSRTQRDKIVNGCVYASISWWNWPCFICTWQKKKKWYSDFACIMPVHAKQFLYKVWDVTAHLSDVLSVACYLQLFIFSILYPLYCSVWTIENMRWILFAVYLFSLCWYKINVSILGISSKEICLTLQSCPLHICNPFIYSSR